MLKFLRAEIWMVLLASATALSEPEKLCPRFVLKENQHLSLSEAEKRLVCGDPKNEAWDNIPNNQAIFNLKTFLQDRAYFDSKFEQKEGKVFIDLGEVSKVTSFNVRGEPGNLPVEKMRNIVGETLTPKLLDSVKQRVTQQLQSRGYACPKVKLEANPKSGEVTALLDSGPWQRLVEVERQGVEGFDVRLAGRYDAFEVGEAYNADYLAVTVNRILDEGTFQSTHFTPECTEEGAVAHQKFVAGPPRLLTLGVGIDTERWLLFRGSWKTTRLGEQGSLIALTIATSFKDQEFNANAKWFVKGMPPRFYLRPEFSVRHENFDPYENLKSTLQLAPATSVDWQEMGLEVYGGPQLNVIRTFRGTGPSFSKFASLGAEARLRTHYYEFYRASPRKGFDSRFQANFSQDRWLSNFTAQFFKLSFEKLWNVLDFDPPFLVVGLRGGAGTTLTPEKVSSSTLPIEFRHFLGGSADVRAFGLRELPGTDSGALTSVYSGLELRFADLMPAGFQPFLFNDIGMMGSRAAALDSPLFWSPGFGIRWQSPIGVIRSTLAHGFVSGDKGTYANKDPHWQFYFSFGEEF